MKLYPLFALALVPFLATGQEADFSHIKPAKNIILMISDGTSPAAVSLGRWYNRLKNPASKSLAVDPFLSGTVLTFCSDSPIGDSAPTSSSYVNGMPSRAGFVNSYPAPTAHDLVPVDSAKAYRPLVTAFELARIIGGKKTGIVVTCDFPQATPADMAAHYYDRGSYAHLIPQMAQNGIDVLFGSGVKLVTPGLRNLLEKEGTKLYTDDKAALTTDADKVWGLFSPMDIPYDLDRDPALSPSLAEMTKAALTKLQGDPDGFFLMVEGSKVDWAAHANDPVGIASEFVAFDRAVAEALDFAKKDGNTVVIVTADHGNSGLSIGRRDLGGKYAETGADKLFGVLPKAKRTAVGLASLLLKAETEDDLSHIFEEYAGFTPSPSELKVVTALRSMEKNKSGRLSDEREKTLEELLGDDVDALSHLKSIQYSSNSLDGYIAALYTAHSYLTFTTNGHTGEEVLLACYAPSLDQRIRGMNTNIDLNNYIRALVGLTEKTMPEYTDDYFSPASEVFKGLEVAVSGDQPLEKTLTVKKGKKTLVVKAFSDTVTVNGKPVELPLAVVYVDKTGDFYLPASLRDF